MSIRRSLPRMWPAILLTAASLAAVALVAPQQIPVVLYKLALILLAGTAGYWLDRWAFPYSRPGGYLLLDWRRSEGAFVPGDVDYQVEEGHRLIFAAVLIRRAIVMGAAMLAVGMGL